MFTVSLDTSLGMPPLIWAWRDGIWPCPAWSTWPNTTCSTWSGPTSARSRAASMALPPRSVASSEARPPPSLPKGVRAAPRMTVLGIWSESPGRRVAEDSARLDCPRMREVKVSARRGAPEDTAADTRVIGLFEGESLAEAPLQALVELGEAKPGLKQVAVAHEDAPGGGQRRVLVAGLGKRDELDGEKARVAAAAVAGRAKELGTVSLSWAAPDGHAGPVVEGTLLRLYEFDQFKSKPDDDDSGAGIESLELAGDSVSDEEVEHARVAADAANRARDLQNLPSNVATPTFLAERAAEIADQFESLEVELLDRDGIIARGMGAFAAVAQGSHAEPRLIVLRYTGGGGGPHLGFVGKAVTFDTGGISIKPSGEDAGDEVRHVRWRHRDRVDGGDRGAGPARHDHRRGAVHREHAERPRGQARRHRDRDERQDDRDQQHRRRGPPDPGRRPLLRGRAGRRADRGPGHADRGDHHRAGLELRGPVLERRRLVRPGRGRLPGHRRAGLADCRCTPSTSS